MDTHASTVDEVKEVIVRTLGIEDRARTLDASTPLLGSMPELDSLSVVELAVALETRFGFEIDDNEFTADIFETVGALTEFVDRNRA